MAEVNKELFALQQQLKLVQQKHQEANKQYEETKQRELIWKKPTKNWRKEFEWLKKLQNSERKLKI